MPARTLPPPTELAAKNKSCFTDKSAEYTLAARAGALSLEVAIPWVCNINPTGRTRRNNLDGGSLRHHVSFVPKNVYVITTGVDKAHPLRVHVRLAGGIVPFVIGYRSGRDDDQATSRVRVPASASAGGPDITLHVDVGRSLRLLQRLPELLVPLRIPTARKGANEVNFVKSAHSEQRGFVPFIRCCQGPAKMMESRNGDYGADQH